MPDWEEEKFWDYAAGCFQSDATLRSYRSDAVGFRKETEIGFLEANADIAGAYCRYLLSIAEEGKMARSTVAKKIRALCSMRGMASSVGMAKENPFTDWLPEAAKQEKFVKTVPIDLVDKVLAAADADLQDRCILTLGLRTGMTSSEICSLKLNAITEYDNGMFILPAGRERPCYVPQDAAIVLKQFLAECDRGDNEIIFRNSRGNPLNLMWISRMMKRLCGAAGVEAFSFETLRNVCGVEMSLSGIPTILGGEQLGITAAPVRRYRKTAYAHELSNAMEHLTRLRIEEEPGTSRRGSIKTESDGNNE